MDALAIFELGAKAGRAYVRAIRQAWAEAFAEAYKDRPADPQSDYYASRLGRAEEGGEALEPSPAIAEVQSRLDQLGAYRERCHRRKPNDPPNIATFCDELVGHDGDHRHGQSEFWANAAVERLVPLCTFCDLPKGHVGGHIGCRCTDCSAANSVADTAPPVPSSSAGRGVGSPGVSAGAEESAPPGWRSDVGTIVAEVLAEHQAWLRTTDDGYNGRVYCYGACFGDDCAPHAMYDDQRAWREHVAPIIAAAVGVGATPTPKPAEEGEK